MGELILAAFLVGLFFTVGKEVGLFLGEFVRSCATALLVPKLQRFIDKIENRQTKGDDEKPDKIRMGFQVD